MDKQTMPLSLQKAGLKAGGLPFLVFVAAAAFLILIGCIPVWASLGGDAASVQADQVHMRGSLRTTTAENYSVREIQSANGTVVREYVSAEGQVFGIAWQAPFPPDLRQLLGSYFDQYKQAVNAQSAASRMGRRPLTIQQPGLVVQMAGHPRAFAGRAYLPEQLPTNVKAEAIR
jgi:hypothetical protein